MDLNIELLPEQETIRIVKAETKGLKDNRNLDLSTTAEPYKVPFLSKNQFTTFTFLSILSKVALGQANQIL